jgi:hypothetical protein
VRGRVVQDSKRSRKFEVGPEGGVYRWDQTLHDTPRLFGLGNCGTVCGCCHGIEAKKATDPKFKSEIDSIVTTIVNKRFDHYHHSNGWQYGFRHVVRFDATF